MITTKMKLTGFSIINVAWAVIMFNSCNPELPATNVTNAVPLLSGTMFILISGIAMIASLMHKENREE